MKIPLPKYERERVHGQVKLKLCQYPDCGKEFYGSFLSKFCPNHSDPSFRRHLRYAEYKEKQKQKENCNISLGHFKTTTKVELECALEGCKEKFTIIAAYKPQNYPKYCEKHRNEYKRQLFLKKNR